MFEPASILMAPLFLFTGLFIGIWRLFCLFGLLYALPVVALILGAYLYNKRNNLPAAATLAFTAGIGQVLSFLSWILSRHAIDGGDAIRTWSGVYSTAVAGFPFAALELPPPPMGADTIPHEQWAAVFVNQTFWFLIGFIVTGILLHFWKPIQKHAWKISATIACAFVLYNLALFAVWFD